MPKRYVITRLDGFAATGAALLTIALLMRGAGNLNASVYFPDVPASHQYSTEIDSVKERGIFYGRPDGTFGPDDTINRAEIMAIIYRTRGNTLRPCGQPPFRDIEMDDWFAKSVCAAKSENIVGGYPDGRFGPAQAVSFAEFARIISNAFRLPMEDDTGLWYERYLRALQALNAIPPSIRGPEQKPTRGEVAFVFDKLRDQWRELINRQLQERDEFLKSQPPPQSTPGTGGGSQSASSQSSRSASSSAQAAGSSSSPQATPTASSSAQSSRSSSAQPQSSSSSTQSVASSSRASSLSSQSSSRNLVPLPVNGGSSSRSSSSAAQQAFTNQVRVRAIDGERIAVNSKGQAVMVRAYQFPMHDIYAAAFDGTTWSPQRVVREKTGDNNPYQLLALSLGDYGQAVAVFQSSVTPGFHALHFNAFDPNGAIAMYQLEAPAQNAAAPQYGYDRRGNMVFVYSSVRLADGGAPDVQGQPLTHELHIQYIHAANRGFNKLYEPPLTYTAGVRSGVYGVAVGNEGQAFVSWIEEPHTGSLQLSRSTFSHGAGVWQQPVTVADNHLNFGEPARAAIDSSGLATVVYSDDVPCIDASGNQTSTMTATYVKRYYGAAWSEPLGGCLFNYAITGGGLPAADVKTDDEGRVFLTTKVIGSSTEARETRMYSPATGWSAAKPLPNPRADAIPTLIVAGKNGTAAAIYTLGHGNKTEQETAYATQIPYNAYGSTFTATNGWSAPTALESEYPTATVNGGAAIGAGTSGFTFLWGQGFHNPDVIRTRFIKP